MDSGFYRGTNAEQDGRFTDKEKKLLKTMKFEGVLDTKVNLTKVNMEVIKPWITGKLNELMGSEDDVLVEYVFTQLEEINVNPKVMQINLTGFLNAKLSREFMAELWQMFIDAQASPDGIPSSIVDKKMQELKVASDARARSVRDGEKVGRDGEKIATNESSMSKATESDWNNRYQSLTGGRYGKDTSFVAEGNGQSKSSPVIARREYDRNDDRGSGRRDRDRSRERQVDRSRDRERERDRERDAPRDRDRSRDRVRGGEKNRERSRERVDRRAGGGNGATATVGGAAGDGYHGTEREKSSRRRSRTPPLLSASRAGAERSASPPPRRRFTEEPAAAPIDDDNWGEEDEEAYERKLTWQKISSKVVVRKYSEDEKDEKEKSADEGAENAEEEKHKTKRKRRKEHRHSSDSDTEHKKSKKHKKDKRKKRDKDRD